MSHTRKCKATRSSPRGRAGGRAGGAGYDFQDIYVALQLGKLLVGDRDRPIEVLWEKKAIEARKRGVAEAVYVDDAVIHCESETWVFVQIKQASHGKDWSAKEFVQSGVAEQFWREWFSRSQADRQKVVLRLATAGDCRRLKVVMDVALRSRTTAELSSCEATVETIKDIETIAEGLGRSADDADFFHFLKSLQVEALPAADELENWLVRSLAVFGANAKDVATHLVRLVARSKHAGPKARSSYTRETLVRGLLDDGVPRETLMVAALIPPSRSVEDSFWAKYRDKVVRAFRTLRVYGLETEHVVHADLPALFVPLRLAPIVAEQELHPKLGTSETRRRSLENSILEDETQNETETDEEKPRRDSGVLEMAEVLAHKRRIVLVGGPGAGKTTTLKWCAVVAAMSGREGREIRQRFGLPAEPLIPLYVRFRDFARWVQANGLDGMEGKLGLVANFVAATFVRDFGDKFPTRIEAFRVASEVLASEKAVFLFDGLDEVPDELMRQRLFDSVANLLEEYKQPRVILSSRPYAFSQGHSLLGLELFEPLPLGRQARRTFAVQWYRAIKTNLGGQGISDHDAAARAEDLARTAEKLKDVAENPLLLSILALIHFNKNGLPVERAKLYDHATLAMLGHWDRSASGRDLGDDTIPKDWASTLSLSELEIRLVVERLAYQIQFSEGGSEFPKKVALEVLSEGIAAVTSSAHARARAELLLKLLAERSGLLQELSPEVFAFTHLSFQEYLAARTLLTRANAGGDDIANCTCDEKHTEVLRFAVAILAANVGPEANEKTLRLISRIGETHPSLAAACLLEAPSVRLEAEVTEALARRVFHECSGKGRFFHRPRLVSRLMWCLLGHSKNSDRMLLEFLASGDEGHRHPMGDEVPLAILAGRPKGRPSPQLEWVLKRLRKAQNRDHYDVNVGNLARLILTEEGIESPESNLLQLVDLVGRDDHFGGATGERAERILRPLFSSERDNTEACRVLVEPFRSSERGFADSWQAWRIVEFMRSVGLPLGPEFAEVLIRHGFSNDSRRVECSQRIREHLKHPDARVAVVSVLKNGLSDRDADVRLECSRLLQETQAPLTATEQELVKEVQIRDSIELAGKRCNWKRDDAEDGENWNACSSIIQRLLSNQTTRDKTLAVLVEKLWNPERSETCFAATMLLEAGLGQTPGVIQAFVNDGLSSKGWRPAASNYLKDLRSHSLTRHATRALLIEGLRGRTDTVAADLRKKESDSRSREDVQKENNAVSTACAITLLEVGETHDERLLAAIIPASLLDSAQTEVVASHLLKMLNTELRKQVSEQIGEFFASEHIDVAVASVMAMASADAGCFDIPNLSRGLVLGGLSKEGDHARVMQQLVNMLKTPKCATSVRKALSEGLASDDKDVAWGAASCLCQHSERTDAELPAAIIRAGLIKESRRDQARIWLRELMTNPFTARTTQQAMDEAAADGLSRSYRGGWQNAALAWGIARCLLVEKKTEAEYLPDAVIFGGLIERENHSDAVEVLKPAFDEDSDFAKKMSEKLWTVLGASDEESSQDRAVSWGAVRVLIETGQLPPDGDWWVHKPDADKDVGPTTRLQKVLRVVMREIEREPVANGFVEAFLKTPETTALARRALVGLLDNKTAEVAFEAARSLVRLGDFEHLSLAVAVAKHGLGREATHDQAVEIMDKLRSMPSMVQAVRTSLVMAAWGKDEQAARAAAEYLMDKGEAANPCVPRGLITGRMWWREGGSDTVHRLQTLIDNPDSHQATVDALLAALYREEKHSPQFDLIWLLVRAGVPLYDRILAGMADASRWGTPVAPLASVVLTGREQEAIQGAKRFGLVELAELLTD